MDKPNPNPNPNPEFPGFPEFIFQHSVKLSKLAYRTGLKTLFHLKKIEEHFLMVTFSYILEVIF
jgi:hypothetical protein